MKGKILDLRKIICILLLVMGVLVFSSCKKEPAVTGDAPDVDAPAAAAVEPAAKNVPLVIELPQALFAGTPKPMANMENLETPRPAGQARPVFYVPAGTTNVALGKPVTSSSLAPIVGSLDMITDGDKEGADGSYVELDPFEQQVTIDLGASYEIYALVLWHYHKETVIYYDVVIQTADDADFIENVNTLFNNDTDNTHGLGIGTDKNYVDTYEGRLIDGKGTVGRYVRFYSAGNTENEMNYYIEAEVFAKPVE